MIKIGAISVSTLSLVATVVRAIDSARSTGEAEDGIISGAGLEVEHDAAIGLNCHGGP